jgi:hypothetical protein
MIMIYVEPISWKPREVITAADLAGLVYSLLQVGELFRRDCIAALEVSSSLNLRGVRRHVNGTRPSWDHA